MDLADEGRVVENVALQRLATLTKVRVFGEIADELLERRLDLLPPGMVGAAHFGEQLLDPIDGAVGHHRIDPFGNEPRGLLRDLFAQNILVAREQQLRVLDQAVEQRLGFAARPEKRQQLRSDRRGGDRVQRAQDGACKSVGHALFRQRVERLGQENGSPVPRFFAHGREPK